MVSEAHNLIALLSVKKVDIDIDKSVTRFGTTTIVNYRVLQVVCVAVIAQGSSDQLAGEPRSDSGCVCARTSLKACLVAVKVAKTPANVFLQFPAGLLSYTGRLLPSDACAQSNLQHVICIPVSCPLR